MLTSWSSFYIQTTIFLISKTSAFNMDKIPQRYLQPPEPVPTFDTQPEMTQTYVKSTHHGNKNLDDLNQPLRLPRIALPKRKAERRQTGMETTTSNPAIDITSVSPIESSFGGLTGLTGLPELSIVQAVKLMAAVFPFILPLVFVPLLIFSVGIFFWPVARVHYTVEDKETGDGIFFIQNPKNIFPHPSEDDDVKIFVKPKSRR